MFFRRAAGAVFFLTLAGVSYANVTAEQTDIGEQRPGAQVVAHLTLFNGSDKVATVLSAQAISGRLNAQALPVTVKPHGSAVVNVAVEIERQLGKQSYLIDFELDTDQKKLRSSISLFVDSAMDGEPMQVDIGQITAGKQAEERVPFASRDLADIRAASASDAAGLLLPEIADGGRAVVLRTRADAPWGIHKGWVEVKTNSTQQPSAWIKYRFEARGRVVPETYDVDAGIVRIGKVTPQTLFVRDVEGAPLQLGSLVQHGSKVDVTQGACPDKSESCRALTIKVDDTQRIGRLSGTLDIQLPQYKQVLTVRYGGLLLDADSKITDLSSTASNKSPETAPRQNLVTALKSATVSQPAAIVSPTPPGGGPLLKWSIQNEQQLYGYIIYRADSENGPMRRMNTSIIRTLSAQDRVPVEYRWRDTAAKLGNTYWYQIGTVTQRDVRANLTGIVKKAYTSDEHVKPAK